jgi:predicted dienelactone hydrolase
MRIFEATLIVVNLCSLYLSLGKPSKRVWLAAGMNLAVFLVHGVFEGFRYQMAFSYVFVILLGLYALAKTRDRFFEARAPKVLKVIGISLSLILLGFTAFLAYALPVFALPEPTGDHAVGIQYFHWIDGERKEPFLAGSTKPRELMVKVYYPAQEDGSKPYSPYFHGSLELVRLLTTGYGMPEFLFDHLVLVRTNSKEGLLLSDRQRGYPVILFSHGAGTTLEVETSQSEDLASRGYIVVAIDHTYASAGTVFPERVVSAREATTNFDTPEPAEIITQIMADDAAFVMDQLGELNEGRVDSIFTGRLDLEHIGAVGHSVGGAVAYHLAIDDPRVKAAVDLDGVVFLAPQGNPQDMPPFLMLASDTFHVQAIRQRRSLMKKLEELPPEEREFLISVYGSEQIYREAYNRAQENLMGLIGVLEASGDLYTIEGSDHMKFTDVGFFIGDRRLRELINIRGETDPARCLEITQALTLAFFDEHLKGEMSNVEALLQKYPELQRVELR